MAIEITERHAVVQGIPLVQGSDRYFWFGRPQLVLHLIHFALFQVFNLFPLSRIINKCLADGTDNTCIYSSGLELKMQLYQKANEHS